MLTNFVLTFVRLADEVFKHKEGKKSHILEMESYPL